MNKSKIEVTLKSMINQTYKYGNNIHYVKNTTINAADGKAVIETNLETYSRPLENMEEFLSYWELFKNLPAIQNSNPETTIIPFNQKQSDQLALQIANDDMDLTTNLIKVLEENIEKVKKDKEYLPQAAMVNKNVNTQILIAKLRLALYDKIPKRR